MPDNIIIGGDTSSKILKIPVGSLFPVQFTPDFLDNIPESDMQEIIQNRLRLQVTSLPITDDPATFEITPIRAGNDVIFNINTDDTDLGVDIYIARVVLLPEDPEAEEAETETISEFVFQVVDAQGASASDTIFSLFQSLPGDLENLKDLRVALKRTDRQAGPDAGLWEKIKNRTKAYSFDQYQRFMDSICGGTYNNYAPLSTNGSDAGADRDTLSKRLQNLSNKRFLPFNDTDSYRTIKVLTEAFLLANCAADLTNIPGYSIPLGDNSEVRTIPFLETIRRKLQDLQIKPKDISDILNLFRDDDNLENGIEGLEPQDCYGILQNSLTSPCFIELIWNYWHEEAMLIQTVNAITRRFQNVRGPNKRDPLAGLEIAPLRPLNNLMWGYIQDEQHRLTIKRRAYEYDHHYGFSLHGKAIPELRSADSRTQFLESFHTLLHLCAKFYLQEDDTTKVPDGYPILNAIRETHLLLTQGMHNQYGDLPFTARVEMMAQQWMLARPEFREFLPTRTMTAYPEPWMDRVAAMNQIQGWTNTSPVSFSFLGIYGEVILLSIRFGHWADVEATSESASYWASFFRNEIQGYIHAYRVVTGVDLTSTNPQTGKIDAKPPSSHLRRRLQAQKKKTNLA